METTQSSSGFVAFETEEGVNKKIDSINKPIWLPLTLRNGVTGSAFYAILGNLIIFKGTVKAPSGTEFATIPANARSSTEGAINCAWYGSVPGFATVKFDTNGNLTLLTTDPTQSVSLYALSYYTI